MSSEREKQINEAGQSSANIFMLNDLFDGKIDIVLNSIANDIEKAGQLGKSKKDQLANRQAKIKDIMDNWQDVLNRGSKYPNIKTVVEALLQDINEVAKVAEGGQFKINKKKYKIDEQEFEVELTADKPPQAMAEAIIPKSAEDEAIESIKKKGNNKWKDFLRNKNISDENKQSFISRVMNDNKRNNMIFLNPVPKKALFKNKKNLDNYINQLDKVRKNKNFYATLDESEIASVQFPDKNNVKSYKSLISKNKINVYDLREKTQGQKLIKMKNLEMLKSSLTLNYQEKTVEQLLEGEDEPVKIKVGAKPGFTKLKPNTAGIQLPHNKPLREVILNEMKVYENQLKNNMFRAEAFDRIKDTMEYKKASPNEKNQLLINSIGVVSNRSKNKKLYYNELEQLYKYVGKNLGIKNPSKKNVIKALEKNNINVTQEEINDNIELVDYMKQRKTELLNKEKYLSQDERDELDDIMRNVNRMSEEAETQYNALESIKKGLSLARQFTKKATSNIQTPTDRITAQKEAEIEQAQKTGSLGVLPEQIKAEPVAIPDINKELLTVKQKILNLNKQKKENKEIDENELKSLEYQQYNLENQIRGKRKDKVKPVAKESEKIGAFRPYYPNVTEQNVQDADILATLDEHLLSLHNVQVFDIPSDNTGGLGTSKNNPLVKDNVDHFNNVNNGVLNDIYSWDNYAQDENFWKGEPVINQVEANKQIKYDNFINNNEMVTEFLTMFNKNNNGFIDEYQPAKETNTFRDQYMPSSNFYKPTPYSNFADVKNQGFLETDFLNNVNFFVNP